MTESERETLAFIRGLLAVRKADRSLMELYNEYKERERAYRLSHHMPGLSAEEKQRVWEMTETSKERYEKARDKAASKPVAKLAIVKPEDEKKAK
jgi:predicted Holliday junction resolvase-like endonuclease